MTGVIDGGLTLVANCKASRLAVLVWPEAVVVKVLVSIGSDAVVTYIYILGCAISNMLMVRRLGLSALCSGLT